MSYTQTLKVDFNNVICKEFLGLSAVYHPFMYHKEYLKYGNLDEQMEDELKIIKAANLKVVRACFGPELNCDKIEGPYDMERERMQEICRLYQKLKENGIDATVGPWGFTYATFYGHDKPCPERDIDNFAEWLFQTVKYMVVDKNLTNIKYVLLFTEPTTHEDRPLPDGYDSWSYYVPVCKAVHKRFTEGGLRDKIKLVGPNNSERGKHLDKAVRDLDDVLDIYSGHFYNYIHHWEWKSMCDDFTDIVAPTGKPFWLDEYGFQHEPYRNSPQYGGYLASILSASISAGHQISMIWSLMDQKFPGSTNNNIDSFHDGVHRTGLYHWKYDTLEEAGKPTPAWYAFKLMSNAFDGVNMSTVKTEDRFTTWQNATKDTCFACAAVSGDDITIMGVNIDACPQDIIIDSNGGSRTLYRYSFEPWSNDIAYETEKFTQIEMKDGKIYDTLPKGGFCIYTTKKVF